MTLMGPAGPKTIIFIYILLKSVMINHNISLADFIILPFLSNPMSLEINQKQKKSMLELKAVNMRNDIAFIKRQLEAIEYEIGKAVRTNSEYGFDVSYISEKAEKAKHALDSIVEVSE